MSSDRNRERAKRMFELQAVSKFRSPQRMIPLKGSILLLLLAVGCGKHSADVLPPGGSPEDISWTHFDVGKVPPTTPLLLEKGKNVYQQNCAACHGESGAGDGFCAAFLNPRPRNFTRGIFRFKTTRSGDLPTDNDLYRTVSLGLHGTPMPPWRYLLSEEERRAVVAYIKTFSPFFQGKPPDKPVDPGPEPRTISEEQVAHGKQLFEQAGCAKCHGPRGFGDGPSAVDMKDSFDDPITPRNFHKAPEFKRGHTLRDIALTVHTGNDGTPMPSFSDTLKSKDIWDIAAYVMSLSEKKLAGGGTRAADTIGAHLGNPDVVVKIMERKWKYTPDSIRVHQGQVVRVEFQPTDNGLGAGHGFAIDGYDKGTFINGAMVQRPKSVTFVADKPGTFAFYCATQCSTGTLHPNMKGTLIVEPSTN